jgi:tight adherence protein B
MGLLTVTISLTVFLFVASLVALGYLVWVGQFAEKLTIKKRLLYISAGGSHGKERLEKYKKSILKNATPLEKFAFSLPRINFLDRKIIKSRIAINATTFVVLSLFLACTGTLLGLWLLPQKAASVVVGLLFLLIPYLILTLSEKRSDARFSEQLPAALELMARALRSGHALSSAMEMVSEELEEPIRGEFRAAVDEMKLGLTVNEALNNMCSRVPSMDLKFFAVSVIIQRETGGNIAEILDRIGILIRERVQFKRQVDTLTAEGRLSGVILISLPAFMFIYIYIVNNDYISLLWIDQIGIYMLYACGIMQVAGFYLINRIVKIDI